MPSNRRFKGFALTIVVVVLTILYLSNSGGQSSRTFYDRTVAAMEAKKTKAPTFRDESIVHKIDEVQKSSETNPVVGGKQPPQIVLGDGEDQQRRVKGSEKWDLGKEKERELEEKKVDEKTDEEKEVDNTLNQILKRSPIIIFSKSYCPFSKKAKWIFAKYDIVPAPFVVELDTHALGGQLQAALEKLTGRRTVPNTLVSGTSIGGGDDVAALHDQGQLEARIRELAGKRVMQVKLKEEKEKKKEKHR